MSAYLMGIDCGLTQLKTVIFDEKGIKHAEAKEPTPLYDDRIDIEDLRTRLFASIRHALSEAGLNGGAIECVGLSGHGNGLYTLDAKGHAEPAYSPMIRRGQVLVDAFVASEDHHLFRARAAQTAWAGQPMQILRWLKREDAGAYARVNRAMMCKDMLRFLLTGEVITDATDASAAALLNAKSGAYDEALFSMLEIGEKAGCFPPVMESVDVSSRVSESAARECGLRPGTPVSGGAFDVCACMLGSGSAGAGEYSVTAGTWAISAAATNQVQNDEPITQRCRGVRRNESLAIVSAPVSCANLDWFMNKVRPGLSYRQADELCMSFAPEAVSMLYFPFLYPDMRYPRAPAGFSGMTPSDDWRSMLRALYEGVAYIHRSQIDRLRRAGIVLDGIRLTGGAANSACWRQLFADVIGLPVTALSEKQAGALGACMTAAVAVGIYPDLDTAASRMVRTAQSHLPMPHQAYDEKYARFAAALEGNR